jgi:hypothetical protein
MNRSLFLQILVCTALFVGAYSLIGLDTSPAFAFQSNFDCLKSAGYSFANVRAFTLEGIDLDLSVKDTLLYAKRAGLKTELFIRPCRGKNAKFQIDTVILVIPQQYYDRFWLFLEENPNAGCEWSNDHKSNCDYVKEMISQIEYFKTPAGIQTSDSFYKRIFGNSGCDLSKYPLIYNRADGSPSFEDYTPFGGWSAPYGKSFQNNVNLCNLTLNKVYEK